jgi:hypothetical protein
MAQGLDPLPNINPPIHKFEVERAMNLNLPMMESEVKEPLETKQPPNVVTNEQNDQNSQTVPLGILLAIEEYSLDQGKQVSGEAYVLLQTLKSTMKRLHAIAPMFESSIIERITRSQRLVGLKSFINV